MAKDSMQTVLLLGGAGLAFYGYTQGWFDSILGKVGATAAKPPAPSCAPPLVMKNGVCMATPAPGQGSSPAAPAVPPLGTAVTTMAQALAQMAAKDAYILPSGDLYVAMQTQIPAGSGYNFYVGSDGVPLLLRDDVNAAVHANPDGSGDALTLAGIKTMMTTKGLSGLGDFQRHMAARTGRFSRVA